MTQACTNYGPDWTTILGFPRATFALHFSSFRPRDILRTQGRIACQHPTFVGQWRFLTNS